jgi:hypothetical protein
LSFFHVEFAVAVGITTVEEERFKECFSVSFHDVVCVEEDCVDVSTLGAEAMGRGFV